MQYDITRYTKIHQNRKTDLALVNDKLDYTTLPYAWQKYCP